MLLLGKRQWWQWSGQSFCFTDSVIRPAITVHTVQWTHFTSFSVKMSVHFKHYCGSLLNRRELPVLLYFFLLAKNSVCFIWSTLTIVDASPVVVQRAQSLKYIHTQKCVAIGDLLVRTCTWLLFHLPFALHWAQVYYYFTSSKLHSPVRPTRPHTRTGTHWSKAENGWLPFPRGFSTSVSVNWENLSCQ